MTFEIFAAQVPIEMMTLGGFEPPVVGGDDGGGGSTLEQAISDSMQPWDAIVWSDDHSMMTQSGFLYVDRDENGWYDYVEWSEDDDTLWVWKDEDGWKPKNPGD